MNCEQRRQERGSAVAGAGSGLGQYMQQCCTNNWKLFFIPLGLFYFLFLLFFEHRKAWRMASAWFCVCAVCWGGVTIPGLALGSLRCVVFYWGLACLKSSGFETAF